MQTEIICEELAHKAGFLISVGNWIAPDGELILGKDYESHHWEILVEYLGYTPETDDRLMYLNNIVDLGYIRLVFRANVMFQIPCKEISEIWDRKTANLQTMWRILNNLDDTDVHIFSKTFYIIGAARNIIRNCIDNLQIKNFRKA